MGKYEKIVLNVPHSSIERWNVGWSGVYSLWECVKDLTDWHTDLLFKSELAKMHRFPYSRFYIDAERLINDELESKGQGILYTEYGGLRRTISESEKYLLMREYEKYLWELGNDLTENTILIDCHSFSSHVAKDIDVNIGFNEDWSKPSTDVLNGVSDIFAKKGYKVAWNEPYSNSITPISNGDYHSMMFEVNKKTYMNEETLLPFSDIYKGITQCINNVYKFLLGKDE